LEGRGGTEPAFPPAVRRNQLTIEIGEREAEILARRIQHEACKADIGRVPDFHGHCRGIAGP